MSRNASTYMQYVYTGFTIGTGGVQQLASTNTFVYAAIIGVVGNSASASTGNWVSNASNVSAGAQDGHKITAASPLAVDAFPVGDKLLAINLKDYYVAGTSGDKIYVAYLREETIT